jgi:hypothetical protein
MEKFSQSGRTEDGSSEVNAMMVENPHLLLDSPWLWFDGCPSLSINLDAVHRSDVSRYVAQGATQPGSVDFVA